MTSVFWVFYKHIERYSNQLPFKIRVSTGLVMHLIMFILSVISIVLLRLVWYKEPGTVRTLFIALVLSNLLLYLSTMVELAVPDLGAKILLNDLEVAFYAVIPLLIFLFAVKYSGWKKRISWRFIAVLSAIPVAMLLLLVTNDYHHLFFHDISIIQRDGYQELYCDYATGFFVLYVYSRLVAVVGTLFLFRLYSTAPPTKKGQIIIVLLASCIPWLITSGEYMFYFTDSYISYIVIFVFITVTSLMIYIGTFMFQTVDVTPLAMDSLVEHVSEGVLVVEQGGRLAYASKRALASLGSDPSIIGRRADEVLPGLLSSLLAEKPEGASHSSRIDLNERSYAIEVTDLSGEMAEVKGRLIIMRDITEEEANKAALRLANEKLSLLNMVARHDLVNKLSATQGYIELGRRDGGATPPQLERFRKMDALMREMTAVLDFSKEYQKLGLESPTWQNVGGTVRTAVQQTGLNGVAADVEVDGAEIYADLMLRTVFANLLDNSLRHGGHVSKVRIASGVGPDGSLTIAYEDDGVGIPAQEKERIFELGFGKHTGMGMYMARHILLITGCTISERGEAGRGCRFVITVPPSRWRRAAGRA